MKKTMVLAGIVLVLGLAFVGCPSNNDPPLTGTVTVIGSTWMGHALTANTTSLNGSGDISFQWQRTDFRGEWYNISGSTSNSHVLQSADLNQNIRISVTRSGYSGSVNSTSRGPITVPPLTGTVTIAGTALVGETLTANTVGLGGSGVISFQWQRADTWGGLWHNISGAIDSTYVLQPADSNYNIRVNVTRSGHSGNMNSGIIGPVSGGTPLTGTVSVTGNDWVGETLAANTADLDGSGHIYFQWQRAETWIGPWYDISGATGSAYVLQAVDSNHYIRISVTRARHSGNVSSNIIGPVASDPPLTGMVSITGNGWVGETLTANTDNLGGSGHISFQWQRGQRVGTWMIGSWYDISGATGSAYVLQPADSNRYIRINVTRSGHSGNVNSDVIGPVASAPP